MFSLESIQSAIKTCSTPFDGSNANAQARLAAKAHILAATQELTEFANIKPQSLSARYLFEYCADLRKTAAKVGLKGE